MELFFVFLVVLAVTRGFGEVAVHLRLPSLVGELAGGITVGLVLGAFPEAFPAFMAAAEGEAFQAVVELGIFFLLLLAGLEMEPREIAEGGWGASLVALGGFVLPLAAGTGLALLFLPPSPVQLIQALFVGTALAITALPASVGVLMDMGLLHSRAGKMIVSAALFDDVFSLVLLALLTGMLETGSPPAGLALAWLIAKVLIFFAVTVALGWYIFPLVRGVIRRAREVEFEFTLLIVTALTYALLAEVMGLHFVLGAFVAGLFVSPRTVGPRDFHSLKTKVSGVTNGFFAPVFFASIGLAVSPGAIIHVPLFVVLLLAVAFIGKVVGSGLAARAVGLSQRESWTVGFGMSGRGAVELIIAGIALEAGLFNRPEPVPPIVENLYSAIVMVAIVTTIMTPLLMRWSAGRLTGPTAPGDAPAKAPENAARSSPESAPGRPP